MPSTSKMEEELNLFRNMMETARKFLKFIQ